METVMLTADVTSAIAMIAYELKRMNELKEMELKATGKFFGGLKKMCNVEDVLKEHINRCERLRNTAIGFGWHEKVKIYEGIIAELNDILMELC